MNDNEEITCGDIPQETKPTVSCPDCVRELQFKYTGLGCAPGFVASGNCVDEGPNPSVADFKITECKDTSVVVASGQVQQGDNMVVSAAGTGDCLSQCLLATISERSGGPVTQTFDIDSLCGENGLVLLTNYGALQSTGYSCNETDTHNCVQELSYGVNVCNTGSTEEEQIYEWTLTFDFNNEEIEEIDLLQNSRPPADFILRPGKCVYDTVIQEANRCEEFRGCASTFTNPTIGLPNKFDDETRIKCFEWAEQVDDQQHLKV